MPTIEEDEMCQISLEISTDEKPGLSGAPNRFHCDLPSQSKFSAKANMLDKSSVMLNSEE